jgi:hypothetical protein
LRDRHHRQQKKNYIKFLEQDVIRLREMISVVESETTTFQQENASIKSTLSKHGVQAPPSYVPATGVSPHRGAGLQESAPLQLDNGQQLQQSSSRAKSSGSPSSTTTISIGYDDRIRKKRLRVSPSSDSGSQGLRSAASTTGYNPVIELPDADSCFGYAPPQFDNLNAPQTMPKQLDGSFDGINFILAYVCVLSNSSPLPTDQIYRLEHPCRTHFHAPETEFDPKGASSNHELMASSLIYAQAPLPVFSNLENPTTALWQAPAPELVRLWEMSSSMPKGDWEITPVQAWFLLTAAYAPAALVADGGARLAALIAGLARYVDCLGFGTVLDVGRFWGVVNAVLGETRAQVQTQAQAQFGEAQVGGTPFGETQLGYGDRWG